MTLDHAVGVENGHFLVPLVCGLYYDDGGPYCDDDHLLTLFQADRVGSPLKSDGWGIGHFSYHGVYLASSKGQKHLREHLLFLFQTHLNYWKAAVLRYLSNDFFGRLCRCRIFRTVDDDYFHYGYWNSLQNSGLLIGTGARIVDIS